LTFSEIPDNLNQMKASEARALTVAQPDVDIKSFMKIIYDRIREAARKGHKNITHPFTGMSNPYPSFVEQETIIKQLRADGYDVINHPDADPGDCRGGAYTTVDW
jgi:hypothetical protein